MSDEKVLSINEMEILSNVIPESFDLELKRIIPGSDRQIQVQNYFYGFYIESKLSSFSSPKFLLGLSEMIATNIFIRDFIFNLTDRCLVVLSIKEFDFEACVRTLANGLTRNKIPQVQSGSYLLPSQLGESLAVAVEDLNDVLKNNPWIVVLFYVFFFLHKTTFLDEFLNQQ